MTPFDVIILKTIEQARRDLAGMTASTRSIHARLPMSVSDRTLRHYLRQMESRGYVRRPLGPKSGYALSFSVAKGLRAARCSNFV